VSDEVAAEDLQSWVSGLDGLFARVADRFGRVEPRRQARAYLMGLLAPVDRKNGWQLAEAAGDASPGRTQRLLNNEFAAESATVIDMPAYWMVMRPLCGARGSCDPRVWRGTPFSCLYAIFPARA
jgi:hypothetical protein